MRIGFWETSRSYFFTAHQQGLNEEQIKALHSLKIGDRLCLWQNTDRDGNSPHFTVKLLEENNKETK